MLEKGEEKIAESISKLIVNQWSFFYTTHGHAARLRVHFNL